MLYSNAYWYIFNGNIFSKPRNLLSQSTHVEYVILHLSKYTYAHIYVAEGNGNPLQYSCLGNPVDREPGGLKSMGLQRVGQDWACTHTHTHIYIYWILSLFKYTTYRYLKRDGGVLSVSFYRCVEEEKGFLDPVSVSGCAWKLKWQRQINKRKAYRFFPPDLFHMNVMWHGSLHRKWKQTFWCMLSLKSGESREMW